MSRVEGAITPQEWARIKSAAKIIHDESGNVDSRRIADRLLPPGCVVHPLIQEAIADGNGRNLRWDGMTAVMDYCPYCTEQWDDPVIATDHFAKCPILNDSDPVENREVSDYGS